MRAKKCSKWLTAATARRRRRRRKRKRRKGERRGRPQQRILNQPLHLAEREEKRALTDECVNQPCSMLLDFLSASAQPFPSDEVM